MSFCAAAETNSEQFKEYEQQNNKRPSSSVNVTSKQSKLEFPTSNAATQKLLLSGLLIFLLSKRCSKLQNSKITIMSRELYSKLVSKHANEVLEDLQSIIHRICKE